MTEQDKNDCIERLRSFAALTAEDLGDDGEPALAGDVRAAIDFVAGISVKYSSDVFISECMGPNGEIVVTLEQGNYETVLDWECGILLIMSWDRTVPKAPKLVSSIRLNQVTQGDCFAGFRPDGSKD